MATPEDFLAQAEKLKASASGDADYRTVVTQAYYAAFHAARALEESFPDRSNAATTGIGVHEALIQRLERPISKLNYGLQIISKDVGAQLRMLKPLREIASYELDESVRIDHAEEAIAAAKDVLAECKKGLRKIRSLHPG